MTSNSHISVLLTESIHELGVFADGKYIDATLGFGGHSEAILAKGGKVLGIEADEKMIAFSEERLKNYCPTLVQGNFKDIQKIATENGFLEANGVLFDLGISSLHYSDLNRGFSFRNGDEMLDMRLSTETMAVTAAQLLNVLSVAQLTELFVEILGKGKALRISKAIAKARENKQFLKVSDLTEVVHESLPEVFLSLRIAVNSEYQSIEEGLAGALSVIKMGGRIVAISFHSLEDKLVHGLFRKWEKAGIGVYKTHTPIVPDSEEIEVNARSRSALMRVFTKTSD